MGSVPISIIHLKENGKLLPMERKEFLKGMCCCSRLSEDSMEKGLTRINPVVRFSIMCRMSFDLVEGIEMAERVVYVISSI